MDTKTLEYMLVIEQEKNISRAAEKLFMSQPSLSRHIKTIEENIGDKLFTRKNNELQLTDAGRIFMNNARAILHIQQKALAELENMRKNQKEKIRLIIGTKERTIFTRRILPVFYKSYPDIDVVVITGDANDAKEYLQNGLADIGVFTVRDLRGVHFDCTVLRNDELLLAMPEGSEAAKAVQAHGLSFDYMKDDYFILNQDDSEYRQMEQQVFEANQFYPALVCEVSKFHTALHMVESGVGNAFLPRSFVRVFGDKVHAFSMVPPYSFSLIAATQQDKNLGKPILKLIQLMDNIFRNDIQDLSSSK